MPAPALNADRIAQLLGKAKTRGLYGSELSEFLSSGEAGIEVTLDGRFAGKTAKQVQTGLNNARKHVSSVTNQPTYPGGNNVSVIVDKDEDGNEHVYLINTAVEA